jgi:hypothetical protein
VPTGGTGHLLGGEIENGNLHGPLKNLEGPREVVTRDRESEPGASTALAAPGWLQHHSDDMDSPQRCSEFLDGGESALPQQHKIVVVHHGYAALPRRFA